MLKNSLSTVTKLGVAGDEVSGELVGEIKVAKKLPESKNEKGAEFKFEYCSKNLKSSFLTPNAKKMFNHLRQAFNEAPILWHFVPECHIRIESDASGYAIGGVLSQLTDLGQWHPVAYFLRMMIPAETKYETHDGELLAFVEAFKTWRHHLKKYKHKVLVFTNHNNLCRFMDTKSLNSRQVRWAHELFEYYFRIDCRQGKANGAEDALFRFL